MSLQQVIECCPDSVVCGPNGGLATGILAQPVDKATTGSRPTFKQSFNLTNAQILGMNAASVQLLPSPGAGFITVIKSFTLIGRGTPAYVPLVQTGNLTNFPFPNVNVGSVGVNYTALAGGGAVSLQYSANGTAYTAGQVCSGTIANTVYTGAGAAGWGTTGTGVINLNLGFNAGVGLPVCITSAAAFTPGSGAVTNNFVAVIEYQVWPSAPAQ